MELINLIHDISISKNFFTNIWLIYVSTKKLQTLLLYPSVGDICGLLWCRMWLLIIYLSLFSTCFLRNFLFYHLLYYLCNVAWPGGPPSTTQRRWGQKTVAVFTWCRAKIQPIGFSPPGSPSPVTRVSNSSSNIYSIKLQDRQNQSGKWVEAISHRRIQLINLHAIVWQ